MAQAVLAQENEDTNVPSTTTTPSFLGSRFFDGIRLTSHERSLLHSLMPEDYVPSVAAQSPMNRAGPVEEIKLETTSSTARRTGRAFSYPQRRESQIVVPAVERSTYMGLAMPATLADEDEDVQSTNSGSQNEHLLEQQLKQQYTKDVLALFGTEAGECSKDLDGWDFKVEQGPGEGTGNVEDFFDLEEACDGSPSAETDGHNTAL